MKLSGLRALVAVIAVMGLFSLVGMGYTVAELEGIAANELIPEISAAAGLTLINSYAETKTEAELEELAVSGRTIGLRTAASGALSILYRAKTEEELTAILTGTADPMIRAAAIEPALMYLVVLTSEEEGFVLADYLKSLATTGETYEMQLAAAKAYYIVAAGDLSQAGLETDAAGEGALALAAAEPLAGFYLFFPPLKTQVELEDLAINGATEGLRAAGGIALSTVLVNSDLTAQEIQTTLLSIFGTKTPEYRDAYKVALANRYGS